jgi:hypothetical protein
MGSSTLLRAAMWDARERFGVRLMLLRRSETQRMVAAAPVEGPGERTSQYRPRPPSDTNSVRRPYAFNTHEHWLQKLELRH